MENKDFDIEILDEDTNQSDSIQLPLNFLSFGTIEKDDAKVYIKQDVYKALEKYAKSDTSKELGTILIGDYCEEMGGLHVVISDYIEAKYTDASASTLTFTHETWDYVHSEHQRLYPNKKIIGWQHTHPNYGIFLSNYDMFIQENFFDLPFQIAYVIDPIQGIRGFFQWKNGRVEKLSGYYVYDEVGKPVKIEQISAKYDDTSKKAGAPLALYGICAVLMLFVLALSLSNILLFSRNSRLAAEQDDMSAQIVEQADHILNQANDIEALKNEIANIVKYNETDEGADENDSETDNPEQSDDLSRVDFVAYTVCEGDTLTGICEKLDIDYFSNIKIIMSVNGIVNADCISVGQILILPSYK